MTLKALPTMDTPELAATRRRELDIPRAVAALLGETAVSAIHTGVYTGPDGRPVVWRELVENAVKLKRSLSPDAPVPAAAQASFTSTEVQVANETTLGAARRLADGGHRPLALNFANGVEPGGGFLHGARAQEECLCRSSALYATLVGDPMYLAHRERELPDSSDWVILSPRVPVFRGDDGAPLSEPWLLDVITCAAPYAPIVGEKLSAALLSRRIHRVLEIARAYGYGALVLGAWGCGAFGNDAGRTAQDFRNALEGPFIGAFSHIVFAISDWSHDRRFLGPFEEVFA